MSTVPLYDEATPSTGRGLTGALWQQSLQRYTSNDPRFGVRVQDDFAENLVGLTGTTTPTANERWSVADAATAGGAYALANVDGPDGVGRLSSTGAANHQGVEAQGPAVVVLPQHASTPRGEVVCEFRVDKGTADTIFVGLSEAGDNFLTAASALPTDQDYIGFYSDDGGATFSFVTANDNDGGTAVTDSHAIQAALLQSAGYQKLGFRVNVDGTVEIVVNGNWIGKQVNNIVSTALPIETLAPRLSATAGGGTTPASVDVDTVDVYVANA